MPEPTAPKMTRAAFRAIHRVAREADTRMLPLAASWGCYAMAPSGRAYITSRWRGVALPPPLAAMALSDPHKMSKANRRLMLGHIRTNRGVIPLPR